MHENNKIVLQEPKESIASRIHRSFLGLFLLALLISCIIILPFAILSYFQISFLYKLVILGIASFSIYFFFFRKAETFKLIKTLFTPVATKTVISKSGIQIEKGTKIHNYNWMECEKIERNKYYSKIDEDIFLQTIIYIKNDIFVEMDDDEKWGNYQKLKALSNRSVKEFGINTYKWSEEKGDYLRI